MERRALLLKERRPSAALGFVLAVAAVAATTGLIYPLGEVMPKVSAGVLYLLVVLVVSTYWGLLLGLVTSVISAAAFNFFHIPPAGHFTIADPQNWVALAVFFVAAVLASSVAELARARAAEAERRQSEAELAAQMARLLLGAGSAAEAMRETANEIAEAVEVDRARIVLAADSPSAPSSDSGAAPGELTIPLASERRPIGSLLVPRDTGEDVLERLRERVVPALETLLAATLERERLQSQAVEAAALRRSDEIKTVLLRSVSHDLRTPLTAIVAAGDALSSSALDQRDRAELAETVTGEATRLARLVEQLLDLSRLEAGAADPRRDWCSIEEIARAAVDQLGLAAEFKLSLDRGLPLVNADAAQLERALGNVLENAARHGGSRPVSVRGRVVGSNLVVRVVDQGPGIPGPERERIFEPFYRGDGEDRPGARGTGLGLAIAKGFVEANGGRVWAESLPGQGTAIVIELPADLLALGTLDRPRAKAAAP